MESETLMIDLLNQIVAVVSHPRLDRPYIQRSAQEFTDTINYPIALQNIESFGLRLGILAGFVRMAASGWVSRSKYLNSFDTRLIEVIHGMDCAFIPGSMLFIYLIFKDRIQGDEPERTLEQIKWLSEKTVLASGAVSLVSLVGSILSRTRFDIPLVTRYAYTVAVPAIATCLMSFYISNYIHAQALKIIEANDSI